MAIGEHIKATVSYTQPGASEAQNVFTFRLDTESTDAELLSDVKEWVRDVWAEEWKQFASITTTLTDVNVVVINALGVTTRVIGTGLVNVDGVKIGGVLPAAAAPLIYAPSIRPKSRGRKFLFGATDADLGSGLWDSDILANLAVLATIYRATYTATNGTQLVPVLLSVATSAFLEFKGAAAFDDIPAYQRRRRPDYGS